MKSFKHRFLNLTLAGVLGAFTATPILAAPVITDFNSTDSNHDGMVSLEEFVKKDTNRLSGKGMPTWIAV